jgi:hypothetical protein
MEFIPHKTSLELKSIGFDQPCFGFYNDNNQPIGGNYPCNGNNSAPTFSQAFRWLRENHNLTWEHTFDDGNISLYVGEIAYPDNNLEFFKAIEVEYNKYNKAYDQAELDCLIKLIEIATI